MINTSLKMHTEHLHRRYRSTPHDEVSGLFPLSALPGDGVVHNRNAVAPLETPDESTVAVAPVSLATSYLLAQTPLTAVRLSRVSGTKTPTPGTPRW